MFSKTLTKIGSPIIGKVIKNFINKLPNALIVTGMGGVTFGMKYASKRERDVTGTKFDDDCSDIVKNASQFDVVGEPEHGTLTAEIVRDTKTGNEYVKKTAHDRKHLVKEFMVANFLHLIRKDQPESLIMQTENEGGTHFHTLSRKYKNCEDLETFIRSGRINELKNKKVTGLEEALAADQIVGKQSDIKLANLIIRETDVEFKISTIDHESAVSPGIGFFSSGQIRFPKDPYVLVGAIHDLRPTCFKHIEPSGDNKSALAGDPGAKEFGNVATNLMSSEKITDYYTQVANIDINPLIQDCYRLASHSSLFKSKECAQYRNHFRKIQEFAAQHAAIQKNPSC